MRGGEGVAWKGAEQLRLGTVGRSDTCRRRRRRRVAVERWGPSSPAGGRGARTCPLHRRGKGPRMGGCARRATTRQQQVIRAGKQGLQDQALLFAAGKARRRAVLRAVKGKSQRGHAHLPCSRSSSSLTVGFGHLRLLAPSHLTHIHFTLSVLRLRASWPLFLECPSWTLSFLCPGWIRAPSPEFHSTWHLLLILPLPWYWCATQRHPLVVHLEHPPCVSVHIASNNYGQHL